MLPSLTDALCTRCGLCCDGTLFADVELAGRAEATRMEALGLDVEGDEGRRPLLVQPCAGLKGTRCTVYAHRPGCCRTFECRLLADVRAGEVTLARAHAHVATALDHAARAKRALARLGARDAHLPLRERAAEALADPPASRADAAGLRDALATATTALERLIRGVFLRQAGATARTVPARGAAAARPAHRVSDAGRARRRA
jgi:hypothetical protein